MRPGHPCWTLTVTERFYTTFELNTFAARCRLYSVFKLMRQQIYGKIVALILLWAH